jgi:hypothetical protein
VWFSVPLSLSLARSCALSCFSLSLSLSLSLEPQDSFVLPTPMNSYFVAHVALAQRKYDVCKMTHPPPRLVNLFIMNSAELSKAGLPKATILEAPRVSAGANA